VIKGRIISQMIHKHTVRKADGTDEVQEHDSGQSCQAQPINLSLSLMMSLGVGVYESGQMWYEAPGCRHVRSENASEEEEASFYVNFIIDADKLVGMDAIASVLTILDVDERSPHYKAV